jgi:hypothetical protein
MPSVASRQGTSPNGNAPQTPVSAVPQAGNAWPAQH